MMGQQGPGGARRCQGEPWRSHEEPRKTQEEQ